MYGYKPILSKHIKARHRVPLILQFELDTLAIEYLFNDPSMITLELSTAMSTNGAQGDPSSAYHSSPYVFITRRRI
jgi:hypothetical protein